MTSPAVSCPEQYLPNPRATASVAVPDRSYERAGKELHIVIAHSNNGSYAPQ